MPPDDGTKEETPATSEDHCLPRTQQAAYRRFSVARDAGGVAARPAADRPYLRVPSFPVNPGALFGFLSVLVIFTACLSGDVRQN
jgi:hypothetical protein